MDQLYSIPTIYAGVRFRSRLEARWAAFFDLLKWEWHYEPFDLNGWIPDFVLHGKTRRTLVEVKPVAGSDDPLFTETTDKIEKSGWEGETLIVSYFLPPDSYTADDDVCVGWLCEVGTDSGKPFFCWDCAPFQVTDTPRIHAGFCHRIHSYCDRITGYHPGGQTGANDEEIKTLWAQAGNITQWRGGP
jgi:hypothetical protein